MQSTLRFLSTETPFPAHTIGTVPLGSVNRDLDIGLHLTALLTPVKPPLETQFHGPSCTQLHYATSSYLGPHKQETVKVDKVVNYWFMYVSRLYQ